MLRVASENRCALYALGLVVVFANGCMLAGDAFDGLEPRLGPAVDAAAGVAGSGPGSAGSSGTSAGIGGAGANEGSGGASGAGGVDAALDAGGAAGSGEPPDGSSGMEGIGGAPGGSSGVGGSSGASAGSSGVGGTGGESPDGSADSGNGAAAGTGGSDGCPAAGCDRLMDAEDWGHPVCIGNETCLLGDVNNDGKDDLIAFVRDTQPGDLANEVWVALTNSAGTGLLPVAKWSDYLCTAGQTCAVADVDGDGREDVVGFARDTVPEPGRNDVWVALSTGSAFAEPRKWAEDFCSAGMECFVADVTADTKADLVGFVKGTRPEPEANDALVAVSNGTSFGPVEKWSDFHCIGNETCAVGDIDGDRRADVLSFVRKTQPAPAEHDVWVRLALPGGGFTQGSAIRWSEYFCDWDDQCSVSDVTGDGRADLVVFTRYTTAWLAASWGTKFGPPNMLASYFCVPGEVCLIGDMTGDGVSDLLAVVRNNHPNYAGHAFVIRSWGSSWRATAPAPQVLPSSATLLRSDEVLVTGGGQNNCCQGTEYESWGFDHSYLYNVTTDRWDRIPSPYGTNTDAFSAGHAHDSEGRAVYSGGSLGQGNSRGLGITHSARWDGNTRLWTALTGPPASWSPTLVPGRRSNGEWNLYLLPGGPYENRSPSGASLIYRLGSSETSWTSTGQALQTLDPRPRAFLLPDGKIIVLSPSDPDRKNYFYDPAQNRVAPAGDDVIPHAPNYDGFVNPAVLLPLQADANQKYSSVRAMHIGGGKAFVKEVGTPTPGTWREPAPLRSRIPEASPRNTDYANATLLPTGQVVVTGGTAGALDSTIGAWQAEVFGEDTGGPVLTDKWSWASGSEVRRHRHSVALLLRDGRVWVAGSSKTGAGSYCDAANVCTAPGSGDDRVLNVELFEPWYYGRADRPAITACPASFSGAPSTREISVGDGEGESILKVSLMAAGSVTQSFNSDQRLIWLDIAEKNPSTVTVNIPYTDAAAPPGDYMVFVLKRNPRAGAPLIPSIGCWTRR